MLMDAPGVPWWAHTRTRNQRKKKTESPKTNAVPAFHVAHCAILMSENTDSNVAEGGGRR